MDFSIAETEKFEGVLKKQEYDPKEIQPKAENNEYKLVYSMNERGLAVIFNNQNHHRRPSSEYEIDKLKKCLEKNNFATHLFSDPKRGDILNFMKKVHLIKVPENYKKQKFSCLIVTVITNGDSKQLHADDDQYKVGELWDPLVGKLIGTPKLFFIQTCPKPPSTIATDGLFGFKNKSFNILPVTSDFLHVYSSFKDCDPSSSPMWFISALTEVINENYENNYDILKLLTLMNKKLKCEHLQSNSKELKQMPHIVSTLTKILIFKTGCVMDSSSK